MRLEPSSFRTIIATEPVAPAWHDFRGLLGPPIPPVSAESLPPSETILSTETLRSTLIELGTAVTKGNLALAEALAKLGVPLTEANMLEGQTILARLPGVSAAVFALTKALNLPPTPTIMKALSAVVDQSVTLNKLDSNTLEVLSLLPKVGNDPTSLSASLGRVFDTLGQSTENKLYAEPDSAHLLQIYDTRSLLLDIAKTPNGGTPAAAAERHAAFIEGQQLLNHLSMQKVDGPAPLYFAFPILLANREMRCEIQVWSGQEKTASDLLDAENEEYLRATIRVTAERLGTIDVRLIGMWSGRLLCTLFAQKALTVRLLKRERAALAAAFGGLGWDAAPIEVVRSDDFTALWLGGDLLDNPRSRVDQRI